MESCLVTCSDLCLCLPMVQTTKHGLTTAEAEQRLKEYGPNKLPESSRSPILVFLGYMWNPLSWAMEIAAIIAIALLDYPDFALIVGLLLINATISFIEESSADAAIKVGGIYGYDMHHVDVICMIGP